MTAISAQMRDANHSPILQHGLVETKQITFSGTGAIITPIFTLTGAVEVIALWGVITTDLGSNVTAASWRLNDQTAQVYITAVGGTTLSSKKAGSVIVKKDVVSAALTLLDNVAGVVSEPTTLETTYFSPFVLVKKTAALTQIEFLYSTNNASAGAIKFYVGYVPLTDDGSLAPA